VTLDTILVQESEPLSATVQENHVLLSIRAGAYFRFNRMGAQIWKMLAAPRRVGEIFDVLAQTHDIDVDTMTRDVGEFLDALLKRHLVRVVNPDESR
jgi:coenzyme PQQ synthesis protein D (PqqD)